MAYYNSVPDYMLDPPEDKRRVVYKCAICGWEIYEGDTYYEIPKLGPCCEECIKDTKVYEAEIEEDY